MDDSSPCHWEDEEDIGSRGDCHWRLVEVLKNPVLTLTAPPELMQFMQDVAPECVVQTNEICQKRTNKTTSDGSGLFEHAILHECK